jgi:Fe-S-cluster-containing hydrogenase component 2
MSRTNQVRIKRSYENCSGCRRCEIACSLFHEGKVWPEASRIRVFMSVPGVEIPHLCFQCEDYPCVGACPTEALSVDSRTGAVRVDTLKCTACGQCIEACPGKVPHMHPQENHIVICDLCGGKPRCAEACKEGRWNALKLVPMSKKVSYKALAKTPDELTGEVAKQVLGDDIAKEVLEQ